jgi:hypothetical protein
MGCCQVSEYSVAWLAVNKKWIWRKSFSHRQPKNVIATSLPANRDCEAVRPWQSRDCFVAWLLAMTSRGLPLRPCNPRPVIASGAKQSRGFGGCFPDGTRDFTPRDDSSTPLLTEGLLWRLILHLCDFIAVRGEQTIDAHNMRDPHECGGVSTFQVVEHPFIKDFVAILYH